MGKMKRTRVWALALAAVVSALPTPAAAVEGGTDAGVPGGTETFISRVTGLPGDTVAIRDGVLILNGTPMLDGDAEVSSALLGDVPLEIRVERLGQIGYKTSINRARPLQDREPQRIAPGRFYVLGDFRNK